MALTSSHCFEKACREIRTASDRPGQLARAMARWTPTERRQIKETYRAIYGEDLVEHLHNDQAVPISSALYLWMLEPQERSVTVVRDALNRVETDYKALVEIYTLQKSNQLFFTKLAYLTKFKTHLDQDLNSEPSHPYQRILAALATSHKSHHEEVSRHIAKCDAKKLYGAVKASTGAIDDAVILEMFSKRSIPQLRLAFSCYKHIYGHDYTKQLKPVAANQTVEVGELLQVEMQILELLQNKQALTLLSAQTLKRESNGEFEESLRIVIQCMCDPFEYYSEMVFANLKGGATAADKRVLTRVMMGAAEAGMEEMRAAFEKKYGIKLQDAICENIAEGDYQEFLLALTNVQASE